MVVGKWAVVDIWPWREGLRGGGGVVGRKEVYVEAACRVGAGGCGAEQNDIYEYMFRRHVFLIRWTYHGLTPPVPL